MAMIVDEALQELFVALTTRWRRENGKLAVGVTRAKLLKTDGITPAVLDELFKKLRDKLKELGLELVEYVYDGDVWYAIRSTYVSLTELQNEEEAVLAVLIAALETAPGSKKEVAGEVLKKRLVNGKYFTDSQMERVLKNLEHLGYLDRQKKLLLYGPRTLLEFSEDARKHIQEQCGRLIF